MLKQTIDIARFENTGAGFHEHLIELMRSHVLVRVLQQNGKDHHTPYNVEGITHKTNAEIYLPLLFESLQRRNFDALNVVNKEQS